MAEGVDSLMIGKTFGRDHILEKIGQGGMGEVLLGRGHVAPPLCVALKFLTPGMQRDAEARKRFIREARSAAALDHPYICHINEVAESEGRTRFPNSGPPSPWKGTWLRFFLGQPQNNKGGRHSPSCTFPRCALVYRP